MFPITCPHCGNNLPIANILQDQKTDKTRGRCLQCKKWIPIQFLPIRKKLIYLDQSFLSAACLEAGSPSSNNEVRILSKLKELKARQKIFVVVSDVHSRETSAIPDMLGIEESSGGFRMIWPMETSRTAGTKYLSLSGEGYLSIRIAPIFSLPPTLGLIIRISYKLA